MSRIVYVDGQYVDEKEAKISVFDRGFLFADAVYEVTAVLNSKLVEFAGHLERLQRSCRELSLVMPVSAAQLKTIHEELIKKNRGSSERSFVVSSIKGQMLSSIFQISPLGPLP